MTQMMTIPLMTEMTQISKKHCATIDSVRFILRFPANILPPPGVPVESRRPGLVLFVLLPAFLAGGWLGVLPAMAVGLAAGLARAGWETYSWITPFEYMLLAGVVAWATRQD